MSFSARDIVGLNAYDFYHLNDASIVQDAHTDCKYIMYSYIYIEGKRGSNPKKRNFTFTILDRLVGVFLRLFFFPKFVCFFFARI